MTIEDVDRYRREQEATRVREAFFAAANSARAVLTDGRVARSWDSPSALPMFSIRGLAGHLVRAVTSVSSYLAAPPPPPDQEPISAAEYFARAVPQSDISSDLHTTIRRRGEEQAVEGHERLIATFDSTIDQLKINLSGESNDRRITVFDGLVLELPEYLRTRIVELVAHTDDLGCSIGEEALTLPPEALDIAIGTLVGLGRHRHGDELVLRGLCRRERDAVDALRVL